jgi:uncharacterized protein YecT (DUF1311 family)
MKPLFNVPVILILICSAARGESLSKGIGNENCSNPNDEQDRLTCLERDYQATDSELNRAYKALQERISEAERKKLTQEERAWIKQRDRQCEANSSAGDGHQFRENEQLRSCLQDLTETRALTLKARHPPRGPYEYYDYKPADINDPICRIAEDVGGAYETKDLPPAFKAFVPFIPADERLQGLVCVTVPDRPGALFVMLTQAPMNTGSAFILARDLDDTLRLLLVNHTVVREGAGYVSSAKPGFFTVQSGWGDGTGNTQYDFSFRYSSGTETWLLDSVRTSRTSVDNDLMRNTSKEYTKTDRWSATNFGYVTFNEFDGAKYEFPKPLAPSGQN